MTEGALDDQEIRDEMPVDKVIVVPPALARRSATARLA